MARTSGLFAVEPPHVFPSPDRLICLPCASYLFTGHVAASFRLAAKASSITVGHGYSRGALPRRGNRHPRMDEPGGEPPGRDRSPDAARPEWHGARDGEPGGRAPRLPADRAVTVPGSVPLRPPARGAGRKSARAR